MLVNQIITSCGHNNLLFGIVDICHESGLVAVTDMSAKSPRRPSVISIEDIAEKLKKKTWRLADSDFPPAMFLPDEALKQEWINKRDQALDAIRPIIDDAKLRFEYLFGDASGVLKMLIERSGRSKKYVSSRLNRYFRWGSFDNALLPHYRNCGSNHSLRAAPAMPKGSSLKPISKPGPETRFGNAYRAVTDEDVANIKTFSKSIPSGSKISLTDQYRKFCRKFHTVKLIPKAAAEEADAKAMFVQMPRKWLIAPRSFKRFLKKFISELEFIRKEKGAIAFAKDHSGKPGLARDGLRGPTCRYEIDSTVADIYIRYPYTKDRLLSTGRPIIYLVMDTFSAMIVGVHVCFEGPNWHGAGQALFNAFTSKVDFCKQYGVDIKESDWPCSHVSRQITWDRGSENTDKNIEGILKAKIGTTLCNLNAYHRGDCKGTVEKGFDTLQTRAIQFEAGKVVKVPRKEDQHASRKSFYTFEQFMKVLIEIIIQTNNYRERITSHNFEMSRDDVGFTPRDVWNWGISHMISKPQASRDALRFALLPEGEATVRKQGVYFRGLYYSCNEIVKRNWLNEAASIGRFKRKIRYTDLNTNSIWWRDEETKEVIRLNLTDRSEAYKNQLWADVLHRLELVKDILANLDERRFNATVLLDMDLAEIDKEIKSLNRKYKGSGAKTIQPDIKENKAVEAAQHRSRDYQEMEADLDSGSGKESSKTPATEQSTQNLSDPTASSY